MVCRPSAPVEVSAAERARETEESLRCVRSPSSSRWSPSSRSPRAVPPPRAVRQRRSRRNLGPDGRTSERCRCQSGPDRDVHLHHARDLGLVPRRMGAEGRDRAVARRRHRPAGNPLGDVIEDGSSGDTAFLALASQPRAGRSLDEVVAGYGPFTECGSPEPVVVDGAPGVVGPDCPMALVAKGDRVFLIWLYRIDDPDWFQRSWPR